MRARWIAVAMLAGVAAWLAASGRAARGLLACQILDDLRRPGPESWLARATPAPNTSPITLETTRGPITADLYRPSRGGGRVPVVLVPGLVEAGKDDPRVAPFARLLARAGFTVVVPDLRSFRTLHVHPDHVHELSAALSAVVARPDLAPSGRAGLFGISYSGGIAALVAADPALASRVQFVAIVSGYADLDTALRFLAAGRTVFRGRMQVVKPDPYGQLVFLRTMGEFLDEPGDRATLEAMARRRMEAPAAPLADLALKLEPQGRLVYDLFEGGVWSACRRSSKRSRPGSKSAWPGSRPHAWDSARSRRASTSCTRGTTGRSR